MKNFKKIVALVLALSLVLSMGSVSFAATTNEAKAKVLYDLGLFKGYSATEMVLGLEDETNAYQAITLIGRALNWAVDMEATSEFTDVPAYAAPYVAYAVEMKITNGVGGGLFGSMVDGQRVVAWTLRALGYDMDKSWTDTATLAATAKITVPGETVTRDTVAGTIYETLMTTPVGKTMTVIESLVAATPSMKAVALAAGLIADVLTVKSVTANSLSEIYVMFNKEVDKTSAELATNYTLADGTSVIGTPVLQADKMTVLLPLTTIATQQDVTKVTIKNVKDKADVKIVEVEKSVTFFDTLVPSVTGVKVTGPKTLEVSFSEPVKSTAITTSTNFALDNNTYSVTVAAPASAHDVKKLTLTLGTELPEGAHTLTVNAVSQAESIKDFANYAVPKVDITFNYAKDTTAPTVSISGVKQNEFTITFSKPLTSAGKALVKVYHTYDANTTYEGSVAFGTSDTEATVTFASNFLPIGSATIYVNNGSSSTDIEDTWGVVFADFSTTVAVSSDTIKPMVDKIEVKNSTTVKVTFSEAVTGADVTSNYTIKDADGDALSISSAVLDSGNTYTLTTATISGGAYTFIIKNVKDTSVGENKMVDYTTVITVADTILPTVTNAGVYSSDMKKVVVSFSEIMATTGTASVLEEANYLISFNGTTYEDLSDVTGATISLNAGGKAVTITFTSAQTLSASSKVIVGRVADVAGNKTAVLSTTVALGLDAVDGTNIADTKIKAVKSNQVTFEVNSTLKAVDYSKFNIQVGGADKAATAVTYVNDSNKAIVTVTIATTDKFATDLSTLQNVEIAIGGLTTTLGTSNAGVITETTFIDLVAPAVVSTVTGDADLDGHLDKVTVTYSEALYIASVSDTDYTVEGYEVTGVSVAGAVVVITVKELASFDTGSTPKVTLVGSISDNSTDRNSLSAQTAITATDGAAPVLLSLEQKTASTATITVSEAVKHVALVVATDMTGTVNAVVITTVDSAEVLTANAVNTVLLTGILPAATTGQEVVVTVNATGAAKILDAAGNAAATATLTDANGF